MVEKYSMGILYQEYDKIKQNDIYIYIYLINHYFLRLLLKLRGYFNDYGSNIMLYKSDINHCQIYDYTFFNRTHY